MWSGGYTNPMAPYFMEAKSAAANVPQPGEQGNYTKVLFREDFPQFTKITTSEEDGQELVIDLVPEKMLRNFIIQANESILPLGKYVAICRRAVRGAFCGALLKNIFFRL